MKFMLGWCIGASIVLPIVIAVHSSSITGWGYVCAATLEVLYLGLVALGVSTSRMIKNS